MVIKDVIYTRDIIYTPFPKKKDPPGLDAIIEGNIHHKDLLRAWKIYIRKNRTENRNYIIDISKVKK